MPHILVVDDSAVSRQLVGGLLEKDLDCTVEFAANGVEALARMDQTPPDLVVADVNMPLMDGLGLVTQLRSRHPEVPVILMTAYGSESLAIEALEKGAASYVPKVQLAERLTKTVSDVLAMVRAGRTQEQLLRCVKRAEYDMELENDPALIDPLLELVGQMLSGMGLCDFTGRLQVGIALKEALLNAIFHGNLQISAAEVEEVGDRLIGEYELSLVDRRRSEEPYCRRRVYLHVCIQPDEARFVVRDQGSGFDVSAVPPPNQPGALEPERGRGLSLMRTFMDEVQFNEKGNEVTMVRRRRAAARQHTAEEHPA